MLHQQPQRLLDQPQPVFALHRTGHVDDEREIGGLALGGRDFAALDADPQQVVFVVEAELRRRAFEMDRKRLVVGRGVVVVEIVDELLDAHRLVGRQRAAVEVVAADRVRACVGVYRKSRKIVVVGVDERVDAVIFEKHRVIRRIVGRAHIFGNLAFPPLVHVARGYITRRFLVARLVARLIARTSV